MTADEAGAKPNLDSNASWADEAFARDARPVRIAGAHKWDVGGVIAIAGSPSFTGAAYLTSRAAGRAGAGIVYLASGRGVISALAGAMPEVAYIVLPDTDASGSAKRAIDRLDPVLEKAKSVIIGPGLGDDELSDHLLSALFGFGGKAASRTGTNIGFGIAGAASRTPDGVASSPLFRHEHLRFVVDADALTWLSRQERWWTNVPHDRMVLTPHPGEMARLTGLAVDEIMADPYEIARASAATWSQTVLLKCAYSLVTDGTRTVVADDAPTALATAGTGDVLAGTVAAFLAQGLTAIEASGLALYLGARAGRTLERRFGDLGVIATDMPEAIAVELGKLVPEDLPRSAHPADGTQVLQALD